MRPCLGSASSGYTMAVPTTKYTDGSFPRRQDTMLRAYSLGRNWWAWRTLTGTEREREREESKMNNPVSIRADAGSPRGRGNTKGEPQSHQRGNAFKRACASGNKWRSTWEREKKKKKLLPGAQRANATLAGAAGLKRSQKRPPRAAALGPHSD